MSRWYYISGEAANGGDKYWLDIHIYTQVEQGSSHGGYKSFSTMRDQ